MSQPRPQDLVFTLFGEYLLHREGPVWVGSLIALLIPLGLSEGAVRTVLSRMAAKGWLTSRRRGRNSFYSLTVRGRKLLEEGKARIYHPPRDEPWDGRWSLIAYSIPEDVRHLRDRLRSRLSWLGCGSLGYGLWISPHDVREELRAIADELGISDHLEVFRGEHEGFSDNQRLVTRCWDLEELNARYEEFVRTHLPGLERCQRRADSGGLFPEECFVERFRLTHQYRQFPLADPFLPRSLLLPDWAGDCAAQLFERYHDLLTEPADRYVDSVLEEAPGGAGRAHSRRGERRQAPMEPAT